MAAGRYLPLGPFRPDGLLVTPTRHDTSHPFKHRAVDWSEEERAIELHREVREHRWCRSRPASALGTVGKGLACDAPTGAWP